MATAETFRRLNNKERVLARLKSGPARNTELTRICLRYGARIEELRKAGQEIESLDLGNGVWEYRLIYGGRLF